MSKHFPLKKKNRFSFYLFLFISSYSVLIQAIVMNQTLYSFLRSILYISILVFILNLIFDKSLKFNNKFIILISITTYGTLLLGFIYSIIFDTLIVGSILVIPLILVVMGYNTSLNSNNIKTIIYCYSIITALVGWYIIFAFGNGISISGQYFFSQKNQVGAILGVSIFSLFYLIFSSKEKGSNKNNYIFITSLLLLNLLPLLLLRNRTTMVAIIILLILIILKNFSFRKLTKVIKMIIIIIVISLLLSIDIINQFIYNSFFLNFEAGDINSLSADRVDVYIESLKFIKDNLMFGTINESSSIFDPHNFILYNIFKNGLIMSFGVIFIYILVFTKLILTWTRVRTAELNLASYLLVLSFIASFFEYQQPFGPGTTQILAWFFVGHALKERENEKRN